MFVEYCIDEINDMLFAAYIHGGDWGGPYESHSELMKESINAFLKKTNLDQQYSYVEMDRVMKHNNSNYHYYNVPQIIKKENINQTYGWE